MIRDGWERLVEELAERVLVPNTAQFMILHRFAMEVETSIAKRWRIMNCAVLGTNTLFTSSSTNLSHPSLIITHVRGTPRTHAYYESLSCSFASFVRVSTASAQASPTSTRYSNLVIYTEVEDFPSSLWGPWISSWGWCTSISGSSRDVTSLFRYDTTPTPTTVFDEGCFLQGRATIVHADNHLQNKIHDMSIKIEYIS